MEYIRAFAAVLLLVSGQFMWKLGIDKIGELKLDIKSFAEVVTEPIIILGAIFYIMATILWFFVLSASDLSKVYPIMALSYLLVLIPAHLYLKEPVTLQSIIGSVVIIVGVFLMVK